MTLDYNSENIESDTACKLGFENLELAFISEFENIEISLRAASYFLEAIQIDQNNYNAFIGMGILQMSGNMYLEALEYLEQAKKINNTQEVSEYINMCDKAKESFEENKTSKAKTKKSGTIDDLLSMSNKMNKIKK